MRFSSSLGLSSGLIALAGMLGCAGSSEYVYTPEAANANVAGLPASRTPIPPEKPEGAIEVVSYGIADLDRGNMKIPALHVRAVVTNDGDDTPWTLDTTKQLVAIPGEGQSRAMFVNSDVGTLPNVTIARHERRVLDFYFPLPDTIRKDAQLRQFEFLWEVNTAARTVSSRTSFDRVETEPEVAYAYYDVTPWPLWAGWGPYWWYDPFYPQVVFIHARPYVIRGPGRVVVGRFGGHYHAGGSPRTVGRPRH
jgi:hypothetical protein